jgi:hypothetical protein
MRVARQRVQTPMGGYVLVSWHELRGRIYNERSLLELAIVVQFLNQQYDETGMAVWSDKESFLGFLYKPYTDGQFGYWERGICEQLVAFYAETRRVRDEIIGLLAPMVSRRKKAALAEPLRDLLKKIDESVRFYCRTRLIDEPMGDVALYSPRHLGALGGSSEIRPIKTPDGGNFFLETQMHRDGSLGFKGHIYSLLFYLFHSGDLWLISKCPMCETFFANDQPQKRRHCSDQCHQESERTRLKLRKGKEGGSEDTTIRDREVVLWLAERFRMEKGPFYEDILKPLFGSGIDGRREFEKWKNKPREFWDGLPQRKKELVYNLAKKSCEKSARPAGPDL